MTAIVTDLFSCFFVETCHWDDQLVNLISQCETQLTLEHQQWTVSELVGGLSCYHWLANVGVVGATLRHNQNACFDCYFNCVLLFVMCELCELWAVENNSLKLFHNFNPSLIPLFCANEQQWLDKNAVETQSTDANLAMHKWDWLSVDWNRSLTRGELTGNCSFSHNLS